MRLRVLRSLWAVSQNLPGNRPLVISIRHGHLFRGAQGDVTSTFDIEAVGTQLGQRMDVLRLSILHQQSLPSQEELRKIVGFPEEFQALQKRLAPFVKQLISPNTLDDVPLIRGVFFTSTKQESSSLSLLRHQWYGHGHGQPLSASAMDFFTQGVMERLYIDRSLARPRRAWWIQSILSLGVGAACCLIAILWLMHAYGSDRETYQAVMSDTAGCTEVASAVQDVPRFERATACRQIVQTLFDQNRQRSPWRASLFNHSGELEQKLYTHYRTIVRNDILDPLDAQLEVRLLAASSPTAAEGIPLIFVLLKRIELITLCLSPSGCPEAFTSDVQLDYELLLGLAWQQQAAVLQATYETYVRWGAEWPEALQQETLRTYRTLATLADVNRACPSSDWCNGQIAMLQYRRRPYGRCHSLVLR